MANRILYLLGNYPSLSETFVEREIRGLRELGLDIEICALDSLKQSKGIRELVHYKRESLASFRTLQDDEVAPGSIRCLSAILYANCIVNRCAGIEQVHGHFLGSTALVAYCLSRITGLPYSLSAHARDIYVESTPRVVVCEAQFCTTCTESNVRHLELRHPGAHFELIRHGVAMDPILDANYTSREDAKLCRILGVGRLVEKKGFRYLVRACRLLKEEHFPFHCTIVGGGPEWDNLRGEVRDLKLEADVTMTGPLPNDEVLRYYGNSNIMVAPNIIAADRDRDGVPNVILEAMAYRLPIVTTDAGSIGEVVQNDSTGLVVRQRDAAALSRAIRRLWEHEDLRERLICASEKILRMEYEPGYWLRKLSALYRACH